MNVFFERWAGSYVACRHGYFIWFSFEQHSQNAIELLYFKRAISSVAFMHHHHHHSSINVQI